ncbi:hypothetical protein GMORB2_0254 [Geosmithia morbida]|uniref:G-protein coupled receptors family 2 profile 2 domain-containing protein n=1 Tax=Geosmithia morbida TaxID=1094350 RepID=A0A9P4Z0M4_9HYPO|nr:uncharacterized protein GMORB2_0254 [Geosmithia morbida]KAF4126518.1 hypothetical protein GMORB2_0254 [Geosmithia morbida]
MADVDQLTKDQILAIVALERTGGSTSLIAVFCIFVAYWTIPEVRNVQNTFIVFASVANVGASAASIIARDGLVKGDDSGLCQVQGFLFEMSVCFPWPFLLLPYPPLVRDGPPCEFRCALLVFLPLLVLVSTEGMQHVGTVTIEDADASKTHRRFMQSDPWWSLAMAANVFLVFYFRASPDGWDDIRIYSYYMLIWICILGSIILYFLVGYHVFRSRNIIQSFTAPYTSPDTTATTTTTVTSQPDDASLANMLRHQQSPHFRLPRVPQGGFYGTVVTEVQVTHSVLGVSQPRTASPSSPAYPGRAHMPTLSFDAGAPGRETPVMAARAPCFSAVVTSELSGDQMGGGGDVSEDQQHGQQDGVVVPGGCRAGWGRWILGSKTQPSGGSMSAATSEGAEGVGGANPGRLSRTKRSLVDRFLVADPIKSAYLRTSFLFTLSVLVTWIPSSMNRIHSWLTGVSPFEYHVATAAVLPLQGLWNAVIFFVTSSRTIRRWVRQRRGLQGDGRHMHHDDGPAVEGVVGPAPSGAEGAVISSHHNRPSLYETDEESASSLVSDVEMRELAGQPSKRSTIGRSGPEWRGLDLTGGDAEAHTNGLIGIDPEDLVAAGAGLGRLVGDGHVVEPVSPHAQDPLADIDVALEEARSGAGLDDIGHGAELGEQLAVVEEDILAGRVSHVALGGRRVDALPALLLPLLPLLAQLQNLPLSLVQDGAE